MKFTAIFYASSINVDLLLAFLAVIALPLIITICIARFRGIFASLFFLPTIFGGMYLLDTKINFVSELISSFTNWHIISSKGSWSNEVLKGLTDSFLNGKDCYDVGTYSKIISAKDSNTNKILGRNKLFQWLKDNKILMSNNMPYQRYIERGYFKCVESTYNQGDIKRIYTKTMITPKGQDYLTKKLKGLE